MGVFLSLSVLSKGTQKENLCYNKIVSSVLFQAANTTLTRVLKSGEQLNISFFAQKCVPLRKPGKGTKQRDISKPIGVHAAVWKAKDLTNFRFVFHFPNRRFLFNFSQRSYRMLATETFKMRIRPEVKEKLSLLASGAGRSQANLVTILILKEYENAKASTKTNPTSRNQPASVA